MAVLVPLAEGFEEIEAIAIVDVLRRAGIAVKTAGLDASSVKGRSDISVMADIRFGDASAEAFDSIVLPGGSPGYANLARSAKLLAMIRDFHAQGKLVAAICAAPTVLAKAGILGNVKATVFPGMEAQIPVHSRERVVIDGNVITSQGPGTAMEFALALVERLAGKKKADEVAGGLVFR